MPVERKKLSSVRGAGRAWLVPFDAGRAVCGQRREAGRRTCLVTSLSSQPSVQEPCKSALDLLWGILKRPFPAPGPLKGPVLAVSDVHRGDGVDDPAAWVFGSPKPGRIGTTGSPAAPGAAPAQKSRSRRALDAPGDADPHRITRSSYGEQHGAAASLSCALTFPPDQLSLRRHAGTLGLLGDAAVSTRWTSRARTETVVLVCECFV